MTNINCSEKCVYQKDGKCSFENINQQKVNTNTDCAYFIPICAPSKIKYYIETNENIN